MLRNNWSSFTALMGTWSNRLFSVGLTVQLLQIPISVNGVLNVLPIDVGNQTVQSVTNQQLEVFCPIVSYWPKLTFCQFVWHNKSDHTFWLVVTWQNSPITAGELLLTRGFNLTFLFWLIQQTKDNRSITD